MSLQTRPLDPIPQATQRVARKSFPKGSVAMQLRDALGPIYHDEDFADLYPRRGRGAISPWRLALVTVLQMLEQLSDVQAAEMVRSRLDWKYALSLDLDDDGFDASILTDFRTRLLERQEQERLLEPILQACRERGWLKRGGKQRTDSTMVLASVRRLSSLETVGETMRVVLNRLAEVDAEWLLTVIGVDWFDRYVHRFELQRFPKGKAQQERLQQAVGTDGWHLLQALHDPQAPEAVRTLPEAALLCQVWQQHFERVEQQVRWRDGPSVPNAERVVSPHDVEARESRKRETEWLGSKVHLTETCNQDEPIHLITQVSTTEATRQDVQMTQAILEHERRRDLCPEELYVDQGYMSGPVLVEERAEGVEVQGPVPGETSRQAKQGYGLSDFEVDWARQQARCPAGQTSAHWREGTGNRGEDNVVVSFTPKTCGACPVKALCTSAPSRTLTLMPQEVHEAIQERRKEVPTLAFQERYAVRAGVEGTISQAVRRTDVRHARYVGQEKTHLQMVATAAALNLARIGEYLKRSEAGLPPRRLRARSPFQRLQLRIGA